MANVKAASLNGAELKGLRSEKKRQLRKHITVAAINVFLEKGYKAATMDEIASQSRITKRTLYKYFPSKIALYMDMFNYYLDRYYAGVIEAAQLMLPTDQVLLKIFEAIYRFTKQNEKFMLLYWMLDTNEYDGEIPREMIDRINKKNVAGIQAAIDAVIRAQSEGMIIDIPPEILVHTLSAMNKGIFFHTHKERKFGIASVDCDSIYQNVLRLLTEGLFIRKTGNH